MSSWRRQIMRSFAGYSTHKRLPIRLDRNRRRGSPTCATVSRIARLLFHNRAPDAALRRRANVVLGRWAR